MSRWSLGWTITGFVVAVLMTITLLVLWNVYIISDYRTIHELSVALQGIRTQNHASAHAPGLRWAVLAMGSLFYTVILVALSLFFSAYLVARSFRNRQTEWLNQTTHELKMPLANILMFSQTLQKGQAPPEETREFLGLIVQETRRLQSLVNRILQARRVDSLRRLELEPLEAGAWAGQLCDLQTFPIDATLPDEPLWIAGERSLLDAALENLLSNAVKYGDGSPPVLLLRREGDRILLEVSDRGIGIPPRLHKKVFSRFYRVPIPEHRRREGTGLGLHIARTIVRRHKGEIGVRLREDGPGSIFWIRLPLLEGNHP